MTGVSGGPTFVTRSTNLRTRRTPCLVGLRTGRPEWKPRRVHKTSGSRGAQGERRPERCKPCFACGRPFLKVWVCLLPFASIVAEVVWSYEVQRAKARVRPLISRHFVYLRDPSRPSPHLLRSQ